MCCRLIRKAVRSLRPVAKHHRRFVLSIGWRRFAEKFVPTFRHRLVPSLDCCSTWPNKNNYSDELKGTNPPNWCRTPFLRPTPCKSSGDSPLPASSLKAPAPSLSYSRKRGCASMLRTTDRHPASVRCASAFGILPAPPLRSRRPVSGAVSARRRASSLRLPSVWSLRPGYERHRSCLASCRSPPGLVMRRPSGPPCLRRVRSTPMLAASCRRLRRTSCASLSLRSDCAVVAHGRHPAESCAGFLPSPSIFNSESQALFQYETPIHPKRVQPPQGHATGSRVLLSTASTCPI